ncbi:hypothetical protein FOXB_16494 [Fusarium oxysporum f. sp. conglutinans Fo5176]|uniref:Uncharacterized protein n=1 Tax=Fusarium oxysporum (strain Fo5176) TaxID=660025 RepID=F9GCW1_FUSOF|nr:hypothetical protein FOXB_16494 [Fusarium oxysporum f. sp. conglutinans Fo5176]
MMRWLRFCWGLHGNTINTRL